MVNGEPKARACCLIRLTLQQTEQLPPHERLHESFCELHGAIF